MHIRLDELQDPRVIAFLHEHLADMHSTTPAESVHALDLDGLRGPDVRLWTAWADPSPTAQLLGTVALKQLSPTHMELKSMRSATHLRGRGIGRALLTHVLQHARAQGVQRISLETGSQPFFAPARALYQAFGFEECPPFADYRPDVNSCFMSLVL